MTEDNQQDQKPEVSFAGVVYGDMIYWITIVATVVVLIGSVITLVTKGNYMDASYLLSSIWEGKNYQTIWCGGINDVPNGHWYLSQLDNGNGITMAGIAMGVFSIIPAIIGAALFLFKEKQTAFGVLALVGAFITVLAMTGTLGAMLESEAAAQSHSCNQVQQHKQES